LSGLSVRSGISNQVIHNAENLLSTTVHRDDPQVRQARMEVEQTLYVLRQCMQDYERLRGQARWLGCFCG
jgi:hypothetical protein